MGESFSPGVFVLSRKAPDLWFLEAARTDG